MYILLTERTLYNLSIYILIMFLLLLQISSGVIWQTRDVQLSRNTLYLLSPRLCFIIVLKRDLFVFRDDSLKSQRVIMRTEPPTKYFVPLQKLRMRLGP